MEESEKVINKKTVAKFFIPAYFFIPMGIFFVVYEVVPFWNGVIASIGLTGLNMLMSLQFLHPNEKVSKYSLRND